MGSTINSVTAHNKCYNLNTCVTTYGKKIWELKKVYRLEFYKGFIICWFSEVLGTPIIGEHHVGGNGISETLFTQFTIEYPEMNIISSSSTMEYEFGSWDNQNDVARFMQSISCPRETIDRKYSPFATWFDEMIPSLKIVDGWLYAYDSNPYKLFGRMDKPVITEVKNLCMRRFFLLKKAQPQILSDIVIHIAFILAQLYHEDSKLYCTTT